MKLKSSVALLLAAVMLLSLSACAGGQTAPQAQESLMPSAEVEATPEPTPTPVPAGYSEEARKAIADLVKCCGKDSPEYDGTAYVVSDFDNTISIFDITYQCIIYQLEHMAFAMDPDALQTALSSGLDLEADDNADWIADIAAAYTALYETYGPFTAAGLSDQQAETVRQDAQWMEFAAKMRAFLDHVENTTPE